MFTGSSESRGGVRDVWCSVALRAAHQNPFHRVHSGNAIVIPNRTVVWGAIGAFWR